MKPYPIKQIDVSAYAIPTDLPEADGTFTWNKTTLVLVEITAGDKRGIGYTYADTSTANLIKSSLVPVISGRDVMDIPGAWAAMVYAIRNLGRSGIASMAISAVDNALWDLKSTLLNLSLVQLLGAVRDGIPVYGSGGFTSYTAEKLQQQLESWVHSGIRKVKMKIGSHPEEDLGRVLAAREAIGDAELFVDANGAYSRKQALAFAESFAKLDVKWFEEPVSSDDLEGLRLIRDRAPASMSIAAGEYGYDAFYFRRMISAGAVDVLQADATRCAGITGFMQTAALCLAAPLPLSAHCAPSIHAHPCCALPAVCHLEYFHDHVRIEQMLFDGALIPQNGNLVPDCSRTGLGLEFKHQDARRYAV